MIGTILLYPRRECMVEHSLTPGGDFWEAQAVLVSVVECNLGCVY